MLYMIESRYDSEIKYCLVIINAEKATLCKTNLPTFLLDFLWIIPESCDAIIMCNLHFVYKDHETEVSWDSNIAGSYFLLHRLLCCRIPELCRLGCTRILQTLHRLECSKCLIIPFSRQASWKLNHSHRVKKGDQYSGCWSFIFWRKPIGGIHSKLVTIVALF